MDEQLLSSLPGAEIVLAGIADLAAGTESVNASAVQSASSRLTRAGLTIPPTEEDGFSAHRLYMQLADGHGDGAHPRYNAILQRVSSFARAAEIARPR
jgi:hypothetical protein